jgi:hypothetical protein
MKTFSIKMLFIRVLAFCLAPVIILMTLVTIALIRTVKAMASLPRKS